MMIYTCPDWPYWCGGHSETGRRIFWLVESYIYVKVNKYLRESVHTNILLVSLRSMRLSPGSYSLIFCLGKSMSDLAFYKVSRADQLTTETPVPFASVSYLPPAWIKICVVLILVCIVTLKNWAGTNVCLPSLVDQVRQRICSLKRRDHGRARGFRKVTQFEVESAPATSLIQCCQSPQMTVERDWNKFSVMDNKTWSSSLAVRFSHSWTVSEPPDLLWHQPPSQQDWAQNVDPGQVRAIRDLVFASVWKYSQMQESYVNIHNICTLGVHRTSDICKSV